MRHWRQLQLRWRRRRRIQFTRRLTASRRILLLIGLAIGSFAYRIDWQQTHRFAGAAQADGERILQCAMAAGPEFTFAQCHVLDRGDALQFGAAADDAGHRR